MSQPLQDIMNAPVCIENGRMLEHHRKDIISVNEDAVEFKKDNGSIRSYNLMESPKWRFESEQRYRLSIGFQKS